MNLVQYFNSQGFRTTSDPRLYASGVWGLRNYTMNGINYDRFCSGYHRAYDFAKSHLTNVPSPCNGTILFGTTGWGNFGGQTVIKPDGLNYQIIIGHLDRNIPVKVGQKVKRGQTIGRQSNTNYDNVYMASHIHVQIQSYGRKNERAFVCEGVNPLNIDLGGGSTNVNTDVLVFNNAWDYKGKVKLKENLNYRIYPHIDAPREGTIKKGTELTFNRLYHSGGHWWGRVTHNEGIWFVALGTRGKVNEMFIASLDAGRLWVTSVGKIDTSGGMFKGDKNTYQIGQESVIDTPVVNRPSQFNKYKNRPNSSRGAYYMGTTHASNGTTALRRYNNGRFNVSGGADLPNGSVVYIYQVIGNWGRIHSPGNDQWIHLDRLNVTYVWPIA